MSKVPLSLDDLLLQATAFASTESRRQHAKLFGVTDGKAIGTFVEQQFCQKLSLRFTWEPGSAARGLDFPELFVDLKVTSLRQPQSSCPFRSARQKIFGLGYSLLLFVYDKIDDTKQRTSRLDIRHAVFIDAACTADFQTTTGLRAILEREGNKDDILAFFSERMLPVDDVEADALADEVLRSPPPVGYLTISNALQWRLQYLRVIEKASDGDNAIVGLRSLR